MIEFGSNKTTGLIFRQLTTGEEMQVEVHDKFPQMEDVHIEGRRYIEVSVELFVELMAQNGYFGVNPTSGLTALEEEQARAVAATEDKD